MRLSLGTALLAVVALAASACGSGGHASSSPASSSRLILGGTVRCTATLTTPVQAGNELGISFDFHNVSKRTVKVYVGEYGGYWAVVTSPDGTTYDTRVPLEDISTPYFPPTPIAPGATKTVTMRGLRVRWEGPLRVTPGCGLASLPPVRVPVTSPGLPANETAAVNDVVAATGHLLDHCRPRASGVSVVGRIDPPSGNAPPLQARCSITLRRERGLYDAQVLILTPPDLKGVHIESPYEAFSGTDVANRNTESIAWEFVVTRHGATPVSGAEADTTRPGGGLWQSWDWTGSKWQPGDRSQCGGSDGSSGATVVFIAICGRSG